MRPKMNFVGSITREYDDSFAKSGAKIGDTLKIRLPNQYVVRTGRQLAAQDTKEQNVELKVQTQKGVDLNFNSVDLTMSLDDFSNRILEPAMAVLAADIEADAMNMYKDVAQSVWLTGAPAFSNILSGRQMLVEALAPLTARTANLNSQNNTDLVDALKGLFNDQTAISKQYREGYMGRAAVTPLAMIAPKAAIAEGNPLAQMIASAPTFDMTEVNDLVMATAAELISTVREVGTEKPLIEHGGLLVPPQTFSWFESRVGRERFGSLAHEVEDQICFFGYALDATGKLHKTPQGYLELNADGEHFSVHMDMRWPDQSPRAQHVNTTFGLWLAASLLLINAPRGVETANAPAHRGMERQARAAGLGPLADMHTVRLSLSAGHVGGMASEAGQSVKAFHFCRSHIRRLPSGELTRVRAHWRGDPAVGVHAPTYRVAA